jgi:hypothetical protein
MTSRDALLAVVGVDVAGQLADVVRSDGMCPRNVGLGGVRPARVSAARRVAWALILVGHGASIHRFRERRKGLPRSAEIDPPAPVASTWAVLLSRPILTSIMALTCGFTVVRAPVTTVLRAILEGSEGEPPA